MNSPTLPQTIATDAEVNLFARFFGLILIELRTHDLKLNRQAHEHKSYSREPIIDQVIVMR